MHSIQLKHVPEGRLDDEELVNLMEIEWVEARSTFDLNPSNEATVLIVFESWMKKAGFERVKKIHAEQNLRYKTFH